MPYNVKIITNAIVNTTKSLCNKPLLYTGCIAISLFTLPSFAQPLNWEGDKPPKEGFLYKPTDYYYFEKNPDIDFEKYGVIIKQAEEYLSSFRTFSAKFTQINPNSTISDGTIQISRPGKARWEFIKPEQAVMIVNDGNLVFYDKELDQISYADVPTTPLNILLYEKVTFDGNATIVDIEENKKALHITLAPGNKESNEHKYQSLVMSFDKDPFTLRRLVRRDQRNVSTTVVLKKIEIDKPIEKDVFIFKNPRLYQRSRRRGDK